MTQTSKKPSQPQENAPKAEWPSQYRNSRSGREYQPHNDEESAWLADRSRRYYLAKGGEGSGKSVLGIRRDLEYLAIGNVTGILASPDLPHFKKSLWPEFKAWCPWQVVVPEQRYRGNTSWEPREPFTLTFINGSQLICGGMDDPEAWEGPNVHFAHLDEARRKKSDEALKVLDGRIRLELPNGWPPALWMTTTPRKHWLYKYFGPLLIEGEEEDPHKEFKLDSLVITLKTLDNELAGNLAKGYTAKRGQSLTPAEKRVRQEAEWEDDDDTDRFLTSIILWDNCREELPTPDRYTPLVLGVDGSEVNDNFAIVGVSRHPERRDEVAVRLVRLWEPRGKQLDYDVIEQEIIDLCRSNNIVHIAFDKYQLLYMMERIYKAGHALTEQFSQAGPRQEADKQLLDMITQRRIAHDGNAQLKQHLDNADKRKNVDGKIRIDKRENSLKVDLAVALSMAVARCLELNL